MRERVPRSLVTSGDSETEPLRAVILTALPVEYDCVRAHLTSVHEDVHPAGTVYERGSFRSDGRVWDVLIAEIGAGNPDAALHAERAISHFAPAVVLFVGVAGGIKDVALGDVVAATKVYNYESGEQSEIFEPRPAVGLSSHAMVQRARAEARRSDWYERLERAQLIEGEEPRVIVGPILAGEKVVTDPRTELARFLRAQYSDALAIAMEDYGFLRAAHASGTDALVIRGISDMLENKAATDVAGWQERAVRHASAFAFEVLAKLGAARSERPAPIPRFEPGGDASLTSPDEVQSGASLFTGTFEAKDLVLVGSNPDHRELRSELLDRFGSRIDALLDRCQLWCTPIRSVSRNHLLIVKGKKFCAQERRWNNWAIIVDCASSNGTLVQHSTSQERLAPWRPVGVSARTSRECASSLVVLACQAQPSEWVILSVGEDKKDANIEIVGLGGPPDPEPYLAFLHRVLAYIRHIAWSRPKPWRLSIIAYTRTPTLIAGEVQIEAYGCGGGWRIIDDALAEWLRNLDKDSTSFALDWAVPIKRYIRGQNFARQYAAESDSRPVPSFNLCETMVLDQQEGSADKADILRLIEGRVATLLSGPPGCGKKTFARYLCAITDRTHTLRTIDVGETGESALRDMKGSRKDNFLIIGIRLSTSPNIIESLIRIISDSQRWKDEQKWFLTTCEPPEQWTESGAMQELLARTVVVRVPSLRERRIRIAPLLNHCLEYHGLPKIDKLLSPSVMAHLINVYDWPGNALEVNELAAEIARGGAPDLVVASWVRQEWAARRLM